MKSWLKGFFGSFRSPPVKAVENGVESQKVDVLFEWRAMGDESPSEVQIAGTFNDWKPTTELKKGKTATFFVEMQLEEGGKYEFKFVVDGQWLVSDRYPTCINELGGENNYLEV